MVPDVAKQTGMSLAILAVPLLILAPDAWATSRVGDDCVPVCRGEDEALERLYDEVRSVVERTADAPCGPQAVGIMAGKMCARPYAIVRLIDNVWPRYFLAWDVGMPPSDMAEYLNQIFASRSTGCTGPGRWVYEHADDLPEGTVSKHDYFDFLKRITRDDRVAAALIRYRDAAGKRRVPHWMVVLKVADLDFADERETECHVWAQDVRGISTIPCDSFYEMAADVPDYPLFNTSLGVVWFKWDRGYVPAPTRR